MGGPGGLLWVGEVLKWRERGGLVLSGLVSTIMIFEIKILLMILLYPLHLCQLQMRYINMT